MAMRFAVKLAYRWSPSFGRRVLLWFLIRDARRFQRQMESAIEALKRLGTAADQAQIHAAAFRF